MPTMGVAIFLVGAILIGIAVARNLGDWRRARLAFDWPAARGEIVRSNRERWAKAALGMDSGTIDYVYRVGDETFTKHYRIPSDVPAWFARYPIGAMITVYYNPARPQEHRIPAQRVISNGAIYLLHRWLHDCDARCCGDPRRTRIIATRRSPTPHPATLIDRGSAINRRSFTRLGYAPSEGGWSTPLSYPLP